ncbi:MAG: hypothetical protein PHO08_04440 [Methylococcales bacterium]|nr:hypothetical protein [Methylococcales bacterium]MDD5631183.1 hypothetical protein [Methylococcales bacterium]
MNDKSHLAKWGGYYELIFHALFRFIPGVSRWLAKPGKQYPSGSAMHGYIDRIKTGVILVQAEKIN